MPLIEELFPIYDGSYKHLYGSSNENALVRITDWSQILWIQILASPRWMTSPGLFPNLENGDLGEQRGGNTGLI